MAFGLRIYLGVDSPLSLLAMLISAFCPVHFDALHAVLVDVSIHVSLLKAASTAPRFVTLTNFQYESIRLLF